MASISLKAFVDKGSNKVIFIEESDDFIDVLYSFLTLPLGKLIKLTRESSLPLNFHCIHNVYRSVEKISDEGPYSTLLKPFLDPYYLAAPHLKNLKLELKDMQNTHNFVYLLCSRNCNISHRVFGLFGDIRSISKNYSQNNIQNYNPTNADTCQCKGQLQRGDSGKYGRGAFIKEHAGLIISDDLQVMPPLVGASSPWFTKFGVMVGNCDTAQMTFKVGLSEAWNVIMRSFVSKSPLTDTLLKKRPVTYLSIDNINLAKWKNAQTDTQNKEDSISVKLMISKSKKMVCYAEAGKDFVTLLSSFLMVPFGYILNRIQDGSLNGCIDQLCKSVHDLDDQYWKSKNHREMLLTPKLDTDINFNSYISSQFIITDTLIISPVSPTYAFTLLNSFKVPLTDFEEKIVHVGKDEVFRLLMTSFLSDSVLTNVFIGPQKDEP